MPLKGKSKALARKHSLIGQYQNNKKAISEMEKKILEQEKELANLVNSERRKLHNRKKKLENLEKQVNVCDIKAVELNRKRKSTISVCISVIKQKKRRLNPTNLKLPNTAKVIRRNETIQACSAIHGGSFGNIQPAVTGMLDTLTSKCKSKQLADVILKSKSSLSSELKKNVISEWSKGYIKSEENILRSLNIYYCHNVMGKAKYLNIRKANQHNLNIPNYVPYTTLAERINSIDIGTVKDVKSEFGYGEVIEEELSEGMFRELDVYCLRLARFYLLVNENRIDKLKVFQLPKKDSDSFLFVLAVGGDGAPATGTGFLISFLNAATRLASSSENFLIFGANVSENSIIVTRFVLKLVSHIKFLESKVFEISDNNKSWKVEFKLGELPNDMKMMYFLGGELSNSARFFSTFANVNKTDCNDIKKKIGCGENDWKPFTYAQRVKDAEKVMQKTAALEKSKSSKQTKRNQLTSYIGEVLKSRQEKIPLVSHYIERAKAEPLHLKNNVVKEMFMKLLHVCITQSNLNGKKSYKEISEASLFVIFLDYIRATMSCNYLSKKIIQWYNESSGKMDSAFSFRFRGKESFAFLKHFPELVCMIISNVNTDSVVTELHQIYFQFINLRKVISFSARIEDFNVETLLEMKKHCNLLFKSCCYFNDNITPSMWTICQAAPYHAEITLKEYGLGLGCNTMEGREQKHQSIAKYAKNTTYQNRWPLIFRHEFIQLIYLRENGFDNTRYRKRGVKYVPDSKAGFCSICSLALSNEKCSVCDSAYMIKILKQLNQY